MLPVSVHAHPALSSATGPVRGRLTGPPPPRQTPGMNEITDEVTDGPAGDGEPDSFEAFEAATGAGRVIDPYPIFREMRDETPVMVGKQWHRFGMEEMEELLVGDSTPYTVLTYDAVQQVLRELRRLLELGLRQDGRPRDGSDAHRDGRTRAPPAPGTGAAGVHHWAMARWDVEIVQPVLTKLFDEFADRGHAELVSEAFFPFPVHVIAHMLGLPEADLPIFQLKAVELISIVTDPALAMAASQWLYDYFAGIIAERRVDRREDVISMLAHAELDGQHLSDDEIIGFLRQLLPAGAETTYRGVSNMLFGLLIQPRPARRRARRPGPRPEGGRGGAALGTPAHRDRPHLRPRRRDRGRHHQVRTATSSPVSAAPTTIRVGGRTPNGSTSSASRRTTSRSASARTSVSACTSPRLEMRMALETVLDRLPNVRLDPDATDIYVSGFGFRAAHRLPVLFDPAS